MTPEAPPPTPEASPPAETPRRQFFLWVLLRRALARYVQLWSSHRLLGWVGCLASVALFLGLCGVVLRVGGAVLLGPPPEREAMAPLEQIEVNSVGSIVNDTVPPVQEYIEGMRAFDAQRMWNAYNEQVRAELTNRGQNPEALQRGLTEAQQRGARIEAVERVGTYLLRDGRRYIFYVITRTGFPPEGTREQLYFVFVTDPNGRILTIT